MLDGIRTDRKSARQQALPQLKTENDHSNQEESNTAKTVKTALSEQDQNLLTFVQITKPRESNIVIDLF